METSVLCENDSFDVDITGLCFSKTLKHCHIFIWYESQKRSVPMHLSMSRKFFLWEGKIRPSDGFLEEGSME
jgi:hypothetical protein